MTDLSIIIISYNTKDITKKCLKTVISSLENDPSLQSEIIVFDNNSSDGTKEMLKTQNYSVKLKTVLNKENVGFSRANNQAVKQAQGNTILFLNSDIEVIDDAIPRLYHFFVNQNQFQFAGGKLLEAGGKKPQPSAGPYYSIPIVFAALFLRGDYWGLTRYSPEVIRQVDWVSGACIICKKADFEAVGGFDEQIFLYMEEIDFFARAKKIGYRVGFYPKAQFIHLGSASSTGRTEPILQVYKGFLYLYKKHHNALSLAILKIMLQLKAQTAYFIGKIFGNEYLVKTYGEAKKLVKDYR